MVIGKARRAAFNIRVEWFKARIVEYKRAVEDNLNEAVQESVSDLTEALLLPTAFKSPPDRLKNNVLSMTSHEDEIRRALKAELHAAFNTGSVSSNRGGIQGSDLRNRSQKKFPRPGRGSLPWRDRSGTIQGIRCSSRGSCLIATYLSYC